MLVSFIHADVTANICVGCPKIVTVCVQARNLQCERNWAVPFSVVDVIFCQSFALPTDAQKKCFTRSIKIYIRTATTCFGVITIIRGAYCVSLLKLRC